MTEPISDDGHTFRRETERVVNEIAQGLHTLDAGVCGRPYGGGVVWCEAHGKRHLRTCMAQPASSNRAAVSSAIPALHSSGMARGFDVSGSSDEMTAHS
ncbi:hypothetical protein [Streptomyces natalensis]|uniref:hypothetical protein n=1 Tax=Streptomyces natalensis TaxID=68242 RepID=UPI000A853E2D|nr:hypothetical protein [Streptomyces natalensis]